MIKIENVDVYGWEAAIRGMRNPMNSWDKSDTEYDIQYYDDDGNETKYYDAEIGKNDYALMMKLVKAGSEHSKFRRMINVTVDVTAPLYWWKEADTYKVGTVRNSCSTMHKITSKEFTIEDFSHEHLISEPLSENEDSSLKTLNLQCKCIMDIMIAVLNAARTMYLETKDKKYWWQIIQLLPSSYNQRATVQMNYEVLANMYRQRKNHKLDEWVDFCKFIETLPYSELITGGNNE